MTNHPVYVANRVRVGTASFANRWVVSSMCGLALWTSALVELAPAQIFPPIGPQNGYSAKTIVLTGTSNPGTGVLSEQKVEFGKPDHVLFDAGIVRGMSMLTDVTALAVSEASANYGMLRGDAFADAFGGPASATSTVKAEFIDLMTVLADGQDTRSWSFNLAVDGNITSNAGGPSPGIGASMSTVLRVFNADGYLNGGLIFPAYSYLITNNHLGNFQKIVFDDHLERLVPGSRWLVAVTMELSAAVNTNDAPRDTWRNITTESDFLHTVELFIDPGADTPWTSYTMNSGHDYRTPAVPEPTTFVLGGQVALLCAVGYLWRRRRGSPPSA